MTNFDNKVLYTGITNDLKRRVWEHKSKLVKGFTSRYNINKLIYYEQCESSYGAISREKQIKGGSRMKKNQLVELFNKDWRDLYDQI